MKKRVEGWSWQVAYFVLVGVVALLAFCVFSLLYDRDNVVRAQVSIDVENLRERQLGDVEAFLILADRFADYHVYEDNYTCLNYSEDLYLIAQQLGFSVDRVVGYTDNLSAPGHEWLRLSVDFEPIQGRFVDYSKVWPRQWVKEGVKG